MQGAVLLLPVTQQRNQKLVLLLHTGSKGMGPMRFDDDNVLVQMSEPAPPPETPQPPQQVCVLRNARTLLT